MGYTENCIEHNTTCTNMKKCMSNESDFDLYSILSTATTQTAFVHRVVCERRELCSINQQNGLGKKGGKQTSWIYMAWLAKAKRIEFSAQTHSHTRNVSKQFTPFNQKTNDGVIHLMFDRLQSYLVKSIIRCKCIAQQWLLVRYAKQLLSRLYVYLSCGFCVSMCIRLCFYSSAVVFVFWPMTIE